VTLAALLQIVSAADSTSTLDAIARSLAKQFAAAGNDDALFALRCAVDARRDTIRKAERQSRA
jgi:hypothetical protein